MPNDEAQSSPPAGNAERTEDGPAAWVPGAMLADELGEKPDTVIRASEAVDTDMWRAIRAFAKDYAIELDVEYTTFLDLAAVPASLYETHTGQAPTRRDVYEFMESDGMIDYELDDPAVHGAALDRSRADRISRETRTVTLVPGRYAAENLCVGALPSSGRERLAELKWVAVADLAAAGVLDPVAFVPPRAELTTWCLDHGISAAPPLRGASLADIRIAITGRNPKTPYALSDIAAIADDDVAWAVKAITHAQAAALNPAVKSWDKPVAFTFGDLTGFGALPERLAAMTPMTAEAQLASLRMLNDWSAGERLRANKAAQRGNTQPVTPPQPLTLTELLAQPDEDAEYRIGAVLPIGGRALLAAPFKAGKSTLVGNLVRVLADGGRFLGEFAVAPVRRVVLIDTELDKRTMRRWLRDQGIHNTDAVTVIPLRGAVSSFDITDDAIRAEWAQRIGQADVLVLDCLRPVLDAIGLSEATEAGRLLTALDELLAAVRADEAVVVTHMGHQNERARGDSRLLDWPDALWKIIRDGEADSETDGSLPRFFSAVGRDVDVAEGLLTFDATTRHLAYGGGNRRGHPARVAMPTLLALVGGEPGLSKAEVERRLGADHDIPQKTARAAIKAAIGEGLLIVTPGERGAHQLSAPPSDPFDLRGGDGDPQPAQTPPETNTELRPQPVFRRVSE